MKSKKRVAERIIESLTEFLADVESGKPIEQSIVRRMKVKGKTVYVHDKFKAPMKKPSSQ